MPRLLAAVRSFPARRRTAIGAGTSQAGYVPSPEAIAILRFRLAAIFAAQLFDFVTFTIMVERQGIHAELNPIVSAGFRAYGLPMLFVIKAALIVLVGSVVVILDQRWQGRRLPGVLAGIVSVVAVAGGLLGGFSNAITL